MGIYFFFEIRKFFKWSGFSVSLHLLLFSNCQLAMFRMHKMKPEVAENYTLDYLLEHPDENETSTVCSKLTFPFAYILKLQKQGADWSSNKI